MATNDSPGNTPNEAALARDKMTGLEYVEALRDGEIPLSPMAQNIGYSIETVAEGSVTLTVAPRPHLFNNFTLHGGAMAAILDGAMASAVNSSLPQGARARTLELKINYLDAPTKKTGELFGIAKVIQLRNRVALVEAQIQDRDGKLYAHATSTYMIRRPK